ncbi:DUF4129 domain-containing protein [Angustibacter sp. McL0619]|uniref:DUF4129 domain-containing protein n=1 Tax=Angustibacter sp. McL0619 TaxID=3415676 RepID=UPI003CFBBA58
MNERGGWRTGALASAGAAAAALVVWVATGPPARLLDSPSRPADLLLLPPPPTSSATPGSDTPTTSATPLPTPPPATHTWIGTVLAVVFAALFVAVVVACVVLVVRSARTRHRRRLLPGVQRGEAAPDLPTSVKLAVASRREQQEAALRQGTPRNAIVACWLELEEAVGATGVEPRASETAAELTSRVLGRLDVDRTSIRDLAELYREARFSRHPMVEADRDAAIAALRRLHADLPAPSAGTVRSGEAR